jgi:NitT/TauT family transport system substrate-binding protein
MNVKLWSAIIVLMIVLSASGIYLSEQTKVKDRAVIVAMVNEEGSGVFASTENPGLTLDPNTTESWGGLVFATPGPSSIQHMILMDFVTNDLGLKFELYSDTKSPGSVYWTQIAPGSMGDSLLAGDIDGGIAWEPHYSNICFGSTYGAYSVGSTAELWSDHPCCVIAASRAYVSENPNAILRFLAAYTASVVWVNGAIPEGSPNHSELVQYVKDNAGVENEVVIQEALEGVKYTYSLENLKEGLIRMVETYQDLGLLQNTLQEMGFADAAAFADWLVDSAYLSAAEGRTPESFPELPDNIKIDIGVLAYDIHQIAVHAGTGEKIFDSYGITLNLGTPFAAGGNVMNALLSGQIDMGFLGSPPVVLNTVNYW